jgi:hypothetical protein
MTVRYCQERVSFRLRPKRIHFPAGTRSEVARRYACPHRRRLRCFVQRDKGGMAQGPLPLAEMQEALPGQRPLVGVRRETPQAR